MTMENFTSPFAYFVNLEWKFFTLAMLTYLFVWGVTHWKQYFNLSGD